MSEPINPAGQQKKMSPLAWVGIGCGAIAIVCILVFGVLAFMGGRLLKKAADNPAFTAAEIAVRANPDLDVVESDSEAGTLTVKNNKTGEVVTMNAEDIKEGKLTFTTKEGTTTIDGSNTGEGGTIKVTNDKGEQAVFGASAGAPKNLPSWLPTYPGAKVEGSFDGTTSEGRNAMFTVTVADQVDSVAEFYQSRLEGAGLKVERSSYETAGHKAITLVGNSEDQKRTVTVAVSDSNGQTQAMVSFTEKN